jgi:hypothetical protein
MQIGTQMNEKELRDKIAQEILAFNFVTPPNDPIMTAMFNAQNVAKMRLAELVRSA